MNVKQPENQESQRNVGTPSKVDKVRYASILKNMLRSMTLLLTLPFVVFFLVWRYLEGAYTADWVMSPLTIVVAIAFSVITLVIARIHYKRDVTAIFKSFAEPAPTRPQEPPIKPIY
ncbi:MAG: hypothetical protein Ct9H300mP11_04580 [Chloroflexota bacterium]|nr:MAG: hypothetical protein Ct9H300mP11_04580 [Chloroflexota bacterium]